MKKREGKLDRDWMPVSPMLISEEKYNKYKDKIIMLSLNIQVMKSHYESEAERKMCTGLSDAEIAGILGLEEWEITKIRTVVESEIAERIWDKIAQDDFDFTGVAPMAEQAEEYYKELLLQGIEDKLRQPTES
jgi:hypothetical protein